MHVLKVPHDVKNIMKILNRHLEFGGPRNFTNRKTMLTRHSTLGRGRGSTMSWDAAVDSGDGRKAGAAAMPLITNSPEQIIPAD